jgi:hypothetical protein
MQTVKRPGHRRITKQKCWQPLKLGKFCIVSKNISKAQPRRCNVSGYIYFYRRSTFFSDGSSAHHQEHKTVHTASGIVKPILLLAATVEEMEFHQ